MYVYVYASRMCRLGVSLMHIFTNAMSAQGVCACAYTLRS